MSYFWWDNWWLIFLQAQKHVSFCHFEVFNTILRTALIPRNDKKGKVILRRVRYDFYGNVYIFIIFSFSINSPK
jgi:hypothetical protein